VTVQIYNGVIVDDATTPGDQVRVSVPDLNYMGRKVYGPMKFLAVVSPDRSLVLPKRGDLALIGTDDTAAGAPWVVAWYSAELIAELGETPPDFATQDELNSRFPVVAGDLVKPINLEDTPGSDPLYRGRVTGDVNPRWEQRADGTMVWGDGTAAPDVSLYRAFALQMVMNASLQLSGNLVNATFSAAGSNSANTSLDAPASCTHDMRASSSGADLKRSRIINAGGKTHLQQVDDAYTVAQNIAVFDHTSRRVNFPVGIELPTLATGASLGTGADGEIKHYLADAANGVVWTFRYRAASASAYKWEFIGGPSLFAEILTNESTSSNTFVDLFTAGPSIALPLAGDYDVSIGARMYNDANGAGAEMSYNIGATAAVVADGISNFANNADTVASNSARVRRKTGLTAVTLTAKYRRATAAGNALFHDRWMCAIPIRVM
jgi:hypothetical protein